MRVLYKKNKIFMCFGIIFFIIIFVIFKSYQSEIDNKSDVKLPNVGNDVPKLPLPVIDKEKIIPPKDEAEKLKEEHEKNINIAAPKHNEIKRELPG